ncbi:MAG TPA: UDP-3-O-(3-hydroxymyristoyl)glucosamine N-acyltransferase [bacterium]|jgi:UDP-3-O-[3-hydroxymyristoyl] glucosamine N-acyltransferase|nr:UDP-3-O-(3-hydroxymyristoyl)glucosamine N-acyltransferase [bacterium]
MKLRELADIVGGRVVGDGDVEVTSVAEPDQVGPHTLVMARGPRELAAAERAGAPAVLISGDLVPGRASALVVSNVRLAFARAIGGLHPAAPVAPGVHPTAVLGEGVALGSGVAIGPHAVVGDGTLIGDGVVISALCAIGAAVSIGAQTLVHPHVTIYDRCVIGARVILHSGVVIGADGFGYAEDGERRVKIPHVGRVVIEDDVEIGANSAVDRATLGETRIGAGSKIDNLVQVAHNVTIGRHVVIAGQAGISGSATLGDHAVLAGQAGVVDHVTIGAGAVLLARAAALSDVSPGTVVSGSPAFAHRDELKASAILRRLPELVERLRALERAAGISARRPPRVSDPSP